MNHVREVCKIGQGSECCKYLVVGAGGFECCKIDPSSKKIVDDNWRTTPHIAQGDNCKGVSDEVLNTK